MSNMISCEAFKYASNMFAFPVGYFEKHTEEELKISEKTRQELIELHSERNDNVSVSYDEAKEKETEDFFND